MDAQEYAQQWRDVRQRCARATRILAARLGADPRLAEVYAAGSLDALAEHNELVLTELISRLRARESEKE